MVVMTRMGDLLGPDPVRLPADEQAEALVHRLFQEVEINPHMQAVAKDPKTALQEWLQGRKMKLPQYRVVGTVGEAHRQIAYPGQWLVFTGADLHAIVMDDMEFRALFDAAPAEDAEEVA